jgi:CRISPR-associated protein Csm3
MTNVNFATIQNQYMFEIELQLVTPLHIGGNQEEAITSDSPIMRDTNGAPFIPGSSLKGLLRTASERTVHLLSFEKDACFLKDGGCHPYKKYKHIEELAKLGEEEQLFDEIYAHLCPICQTYGGGMIASKVKFQHVFFDEFVPVNVRTSNKIDRDTGATVDGALFSYEYIQPKQTFKIVVEAENMTRDNLKVLGLALAQLEQNAIRFGGKQAKGLGQVKYVSGKVIEQQYDATNKQQALSALLGLVEPKTYELTPFLENLLLEEVK